LHEIEARSIQTLLHAGHHQEAMAALVHSAQVIGPILPSDLPGQPACVRTWDNDLDRVWPT
jgi:hypothetical protein